MDLLTFFDLSWCNLSFKRCLIQNFSESGKHSQNNKIESLFFSFLSLFVRVRGKVLAITSKVRRGILYILDILHFLNYDNETDVTENFYVFQKQSVRFQLFHVCSEYFIFFLKTQFR